MEDRSKLLKQVQNAGSTHSCPNCNGPAYCAMEAGKSANLCWCMSVEKDENPSIAITSNSCLCKDCLTNK